MFMRLPVATWVIIGCNGLRVIGAVPPLGCRVSEKQMNLDATCQHKGQYLPIDVAREAVASGGVLLLDGRGPG